MCGIIGIIGSRPVVPLIMEGLKRLEYRGYDSAGLATINKQKLNRSRREGKLLNLEAELSINPLDGQIGIGHTRWATHGKPTEDNAHPHMTSKVALVHNGIIENHHKIYQDLSHTPVLTSETDTEVLVHHLTLALEQGMQPREAVFDMLKKVEGAFALVILFKDFPDLMIGARRGSPLAIGFGAQGENDNRELYFGSDAFALAHLTRSICYLEDGDIAILNRDDKLDKDFQIYDNQGQRLERAVIESMVSGAMIGKDNHRHFMHKEIFEQPSIIGDLITSYGGNDGKPAAILPKGFHSTELNRLISIACGTAHYSGMVSKYWFEELARIPMENDLGSEFRYRNAPMDEKTGIIVISQSGETMDTLEAVRHARLQNPQFLSVINTPESTIARETSSVLLTQAGPEIGVASTKAFTSQLVVLFLASLRMAMERKSVDEVVINRLCDVLRELPGRMRLILDRDAEIEAISHNLKDSPYILYLGRGSMYPIALEGALKLKEISYIYAEGYAAGEMKHGPIALITEGVPAVVLAPSGPLFSKVASNIQEIASRGGRIILFSDQKGRDQLGTLVNDEDCFILPGVDSILAPILYTLPIQLFAYHIACLRGTDVDQPRNLAKSVTVE